MRDRALGDDTAYKFIEALTTEIGPRLAGGDNDAKAREWAIAGMGVIVAGRAARYVQIEDPQWVVIDEVSGQLLTYYLFFWLLPLNWKSWLLGFILFRAFDIWKPFPARQLEHLPGGWGIMADDWMTGIYAAIVLRVALHFRVL